MDHTTKLVAALGCGKNQNDAGKTKMDIAGPYDVESIEPVTLERGTSGPERVGSWNGTGRRETTVSAILAVNNVSRKATNDCRSAPRSVRRDGRGSLGCLTFCDQHVGRTLVQYLCLSCSPCWSPMVFGFVGVSRQHEPLRRQEIHLDEMNSAEEL